MDLNQADDQPMEWKPHELGHYHDTLDAACAKELESLTNVSSAERLAFIIDPRAVHKRLYSKLVPDAHPEYAGTYRGTPGTTLERRFVGAHREDNGVFEYFQNPERVVSGQEAWATQAKKIFDLPANTDRSVVVGEIVRLFYLFGVSHPFLDGNGHIQRLIFASCVIERKDLQLSAKWTIHPRPYDVEIKRAFEAADIGYRLSLLNFLLKQYVST